MATPYSEPVSAKKLAEKYKCSICTNLLDTPVLTECCGQHFCKACLEKWTTGKKTKMCPHCRATNFQKIIALPLIREIKELGVYCRNCDTIGFLKKDLEHHCKHECPSRLVHCHLCNIQGKHQEIFGFHLLNCPNVIIECPNKCNEKVKRKDVRQHRNKCPLEKVDCPFKEAGCEVRLLREHFEEHETSSMQIHLRLTMATMATANRENKELKKRHDELKTSHDELKRDFCSLLSVVSAELGSTEIF